MPYSNLAKVAERLFPSLEAADAAVWDWDQSVDRPFWPEATFEQFGLDPAKGVPRYDEWLEVCVHPQDRERVAEHHKMALEGIGAYFRIEYRVMHPVRGVRWITSRGRIERATGGRPVRIHGLNIDITEQKLAEDRLRKSEERLLLALRASSTGIWEWDCLTDAVTWTKECYEIHGIQEFGGTREAFSRLVYPEDAENLWKILEEALAKHQEFVTEFRIVRGDGEVRWVANRGMATYDENGCAVRVLGTITDIHDRKIADLRLADSEARFRAAFENAAVGVAHVAPDGRWIRVNQRLCEITGYAASQLLGQRFQDITHPSDLAENLALVRRVLDGSVERYSMEKRYFRPDGSAIWIRLTVGCVRKADGSVDYFISVVEDISERKMAEDELRESETKLRESEERLRYTLHAASAGTWDWDIRSGKAEWSDEAYILYDRNPEDGAVTYDFWESCVHPEDVESARTAVKKALSGEAPEYRTEFRVVHKDGTIRWLLASGRVGRSEDGQPVRLSGINLDITERKQAEEQIELLMLEVNHRSKNILTLVQAIARQTAASEPKDFLRRFDERVRALAASQDLLVNAEWKGVALDELIRSQLAHFQDLLDTRITLTGAPLTITAAAAQALGMAVHELATNAGKYGALSNSDGRVFVEWSSEEESGQDMFVMSWHEIGGPPVKTPEKKGFGTTVTCRMAEASLNATVELKFESVGLIWKLRCPAQEVASKGSPTPRQFTIRSESEDASGSDVKVLVVEDEALIALQIEEILRGAGFDVLGPVSSSGEALDLLKSSHCDGAVLDIRLGAETSEQVAKALKEREIPFVTLSAYSKEQRPKIFDDVIALSKPLEAELLVEQLKHCMASAKANG